MIETDLIFVEGGTFMMGSNEGYEDETPYEVILPSFYIGQYTVTQKLWKTVMDSNPSVIKGDDLPVTNVSWEDSQEFIQKLNERTGKQYRLPTEAEWEYAARGGNQSKGFEYAGSDDADEVAWYQDNCTQLQPVGQKKPNELGLYDMSGNVWEWCQDWYNNYSPSAQTNPVGLGTGSGRVFRGGAWLNIQKCCRVACRFYNSPGYRLFNLGFRLAHDFC